MSYVAKPRPLQRRARARARRGSLGDSDADYYRLQCSDPAFYKSLQGIHCRGLFPDGPPAPPASETEICRQKANAQSAAFDAKTADLDKNWNPTGFFSLDQVLQIVQYGQEMLRNASSAVDRAKTEWNGNQDDLRNESSRIQDKMTASLVFIDGVRAAKAQNITVIDAPGLKRWLVNSMNTASGAIDTVYIIQCQRPWWVGALQSFQSVFDKLYGFAKSIVGIVVAAGQAVLKIPDLIATIMKWLPWIALLGGGGFVAYKVYEHKR